MRILIRATDKHNFEVVRQIAYANGHDIDEVPSLLALSIDGLDDSVVDEIKSTGAKVRQERQYVLDTPAFR